ncbi:haloacid dehalogenase type II [Duganella sp. FT3S]|uniref:(S)-2-haloacid dehalogenase n=2 Tax=Rugamonas fusca TaxID=2758568 RepID=A0A7W2EE02_9BURK|nr:haloacid dehalogenase type II [Rugamonas fusca]
MEVGGKLVGVRACVFDAYGTLFDVNGAAHGARDSLGERWRELSDLWRSKQLQYTWLRGLAGHHADFWQVTGDALDFAMATLGLNDRPLRDRLMHLYLSLSAFPEVPGTLARLKAQNLRLAILSNGTPAMLVSAVDNAGLANMFDAVLSVEEVGVFKPHPSVYRLACERLQLTPQEICFLSSNAWDAFSAKAFGFKVLWCNRYGQMPERIPATPDGEIADLSDLPEILGHSVG